MRKGPMSREEYRASLGAGTQVWGDRGEEPGEHQDFQQMLRDSRAMFRALALSVLLLTSGLCTNVAAQVVRYTTLGGQKLVAASPQADAAAVASLCHKVGAWAVAVAQARDAGVPLEASLSLGLVRTQKDYAFLVTTLYSMPSIGPVLAGQLAEAGCLAALPGLFAGAEGAQRMVRR